MGNVDEVNAQLLDSQGLAFLTTRLAGFKTTPYSVSHTGNGESVLGACNNAASGKLNELKLQFSYLPHFSVSDDIHSLRWQKLLVNIAINPLTAIHNIKNGHDHLTHFRNFPRNYFDFHDSS